MLCAVGPGFSVCVCVCGADRPINVWIICRPLFSKDTAQKLVVLSMFSAPNTEFETKRRFCSWIFKHAKGFSLKFIPPAHFPWANFALENGRKKSFRNNPSSESLSCPLLCFSGKKLLFFCWYEQLSQTTCGVGSTTTDNFTNQLNANLRNAFLLLCFHLLFFFSLFGPFLGYFAMLGNSSKILQCNSYL